MLVKVNLFSRIKDNGMTNCTGLESISPSQTPSPPRSWNLRMWPYLEIGSLKVHLLNIKSYWIRVGSNPMCSVLMKDTDTETDTETDTVERRTYEDGGRG